MQSTIDEIAELIIKVSPRGLKAIQHKERYITIGLVFVFILSWTCALQGSIAGFQLISPPGEAISNSTLGFQVIYVLGLPGREDRLEPLLDAANATNITITTLNAVRDAEIPDDEYPYGWNKQFHVIGEIGCLVSHLRTWKKIISSNISTALIMESDADWDMRIKDIMPKFATGVRNIIDWPFEIPHHTEDPRVRPYGDSWDILWIGHCGSSAGEGSIRSYVFNDTSAPPLQYEHILDGGLGSDQHPPGTRSVFKFGRTTCSTAYAISLEGARKAIGYFEQTDGNLDLRLSEVCGRKMDMMCLSVWPQIITPAVTGSNIDHGNTGDFHEGHVDTVLPGPGQQFSARVNAKKVLEEGIGKEKWVWQWNTSYASVDGGRELVDMNASNIDIL